MNNASRIENRDIVLRKPIKADIMTRTELGLSRECVKMCGGSLTEIHEYTYESAVIWYERISNHPCKWIIEYKGKCIGTVGLRTYAEDNKAKYAIEIYDSSVYGHGIGTIVTKMVLQYAFEVLEVHKVYLRVLDYNTRAIKCYEKCGFIKEGIDREGALIDGVYHSDIYMGIIKSEYESLKNQ